MSKRISQKDRVLAMLQDGHDIEKREVKRKNGVRFGVFTLHEEEK